MKRIMFIVALVIGMIACNNKPKTEELTAAELHAKYGIIIPEEEQTGVAGGKGAQARKYKVDFVTTDDLDAETLPDGRDSVTIKNLPTTVTFGGIQRSPTNPFTVDGLMSWCNWYQPNQSYKSCTGPHVTNSSYRGWYGTTSGFIKITEVITLP